MEFKKDLVGKRVLYTLKDTFLGLEGDTIYEGVISEFSPDGKHVKINVYSPLYREQWYKVSSLELLSILEGKKEEREEKYVML